MENIRPPRSRSDPWIVEGGNIFYRNSHHTSTSSSHHHHQHSASDNQFPAPLIGPRRSRPHAIHILTYPPGYVPRDLRPKSGRSARKSGRSSKASKVQRSKQLSQSIRPVLVKLFGSFSGSLPSVPENNESPLTATQSAPTEPDNRRQSTASTRQQRASLSQSSDADSENMAASSIPNQMHGYQLSSSGSLMSVRSAKSAVTSMVSEVPKPVASGSGVSCSILVAEPNVFLYGFEPDNHVRENSQPPGTALLRGKLQVNVTKNVKIKNIQLKLLGRARTEWPEGIPPLKQDMFEEEGLRTQVLTFFNAMNGGWETDYGNQCTYALKNGSGSANSSTTHLPSRSSLIGLPTSASFKSSANSMDLKRLSLQSVQSRSFNKDSAVPSSTQAKGYKVFYPGTYDYSFELPIDYHQLETIKLQYGTVKWELHATVDRAGAFKPNLHGMKEVSIVRLPDQMSLETSEPISINRQWEDQLHYDIIVSGKSFPIGSKIPIAFKLTPLAKVQLHKLKVYITESTEYWTNDRRVTRKDPGRKILLLEKSAGKPLDSNWSSSQFRTVRGGELSPARRREARETAQRRRTAAASKTGEAPEPLPQPSQNLLGDLDLGLENMWGSTEIEANVQIPTCEMMAKNKDLKLHPDCSWKNVNVFHWIKVVMRISRLDPEDPSGTKRRHFEISIDSPFTILNCRATQANTNLPAYAGPICQPAPYQAACGCPDAQTIATNISPASSDVALANNNNNDLDVPEGMPLPPQAAHVAHTPTNPATGSESPTRDSVDGLGIVGSRPMHLMRAPSFGPPGFDDDSAPPPMGTPMLVQSASANVPMPTPPPNYDTIIGTPSVDGLADYFSRLADYGYGEADDASGSEDDTPPRILDRTGRVNVAHPRTPGGRMQSRSFEISRPPMNLDAAQIPKRNFASGQH